MKSYWENLLLASALSLSVPNITCRGNKLLLLGNCRFKQGVPGISLCSPYHQKYLDVDRCFRSLLGF